MERRTLQVAHVKRKRIKGNDYYYLVQSYRKGGKVKTRTLRYLGKQPPAPEIVGRLRAEHAAAGTQMTHELPTIES
jgi:hypothetical protein